MFVPVHKGPRESPWYTRVGVEIVVIIVVSFYHSGGIGIFIRMQSKFSPSRRTNFIPADYYPSIANSCSLREILEFQNTYLVYTFEVKESESKGIISKFQYFIRQTRLFATKGYLFVGIDFST